VPHTLGRPRPKMLLHDILLAAAVPCTAAFSVSAAAAPRSPTAASSSRASGGSLMVAKLDSDSFHDTIQSFDGLTVVKFYAPWCRTCRAIGPQYDRFASKQEELHKDSIQFCEVNFKADKALCLGEKVFQLPTIHFYVKDLGRVNRFVLSSTTASKRLSDQVDRYLGESGHLSLLQSLRSTALTSMVRYTDLVNVVNAIADAPKVLEAAEGTNAMITDAIDAPELREKMTKLFESLDTDANGVLDADELAAVVRAIGGSDAGSGSAPFGAGADLQLDRESFVNLMTSKAIADFSKPGESLRPAFEAMDVDGDGVLTREEVLAAMGRLPGTEQSLLESEQAFDALDVDKSGTLDYEEFVAMMSGARIEDVVAA